MELQCKQTNKCIEAQAKHVKKLQCKQNDMLTQKHEHNNVNKIICKHRNTKKNPM